MLVSLVKDNVILERDAKCPDAGGSGAHGRWRGWVARRDPPRCRRMRRVMRGDAVNALGLAFRSGALSASRGQTHRPTRGRRESTSSRWLTYTERSSASIGVVIYAKVLPARGMWRIAPRTRRGDAGSLPVARVVGNGSSTVRSAPVRSLACGHELAAKGHGGDVPARARHRSERWIMPNLLCSASRPRAPQPRRHHKSARFVIREYAGRDAGARWRRRLARSGGTLVLTASGRAHSGWRPQHWPGTKS